MSWDAQCSRTAPRCSQYLVLGMDKDQYTCCIWCWGWTKTSTLAASGVGDGQRPVHLLHLVLEMDKDQYTCCIWCWRWTKTRTLASSGVGDGQSPIHLLHLVLEIDKDLAAYGILRQYPASALTVCSFKRCKGLLWEPRHLEHLCTIRLTFLVFSHFFNTGVHFHRCQIQLVHTCYTRNINPFQTQK